MTEQSRVPAWKLQTAIALGVFAATAAAISWVDLSPRVEAEFFFSADDPQLQATAQIGESFPGSQQILVRASGSEVDSESYRSQIEELTTSLAAVPDVDGVKQRHVRARGRSQPPVEPIVAGPRMAVQAA